VPTNSGITSVLLFVLNGETQIDLRIERRITDKGDKK
jgi:hypothetical protein